ncbi:MAG: glycosyltransferase [Gillisia sp.]
MEKTKVLVAPLNWGLGHAARCIPIIRELQKNNYQPLLASDGAALELLKKEFPSLPYFELPSYNITYARKGAFLKWKLLSQSRHILKNIRQEKSAIDRLVKKHDIKGIISDNRWGAYHPSTKNIFITHQLRVLSGITTPLTSAYHKKLIQKFDECWIPDFSSEKNLSGIMGHEKLKFPPKKYIGPLSRFHRKENTSFTYAFCVLLSGPEPQRSLLEKILLQELSGISAKILFIRGVFTPEVSLQEIDNITFKDYLYGRELEEALQQSELVISRSGYTSFMDLAKLGKNAFFIPTPGQEEQLYLAKRAKKQGFADFCKQEDFTSEKLEAAKSFGGFNFFFGGTDLGNLFTLFESE